jgi:hypothetical protein
LQVNQILDCLLRLNLSEPLDFPKGQSFGNHSDDFVRAVKLPVLDSVLVVVLFCLTS